MLFQPGFHQALRWSHSTSGQTTYRMRVPVGRAGTRLRLDFRAGDARMTLSGVTVALAGPGGTTQGAPVAVTFGGSSTLSAAARQRVTSDPVPFPISFNAELAVSFAAEGALASSSIALFPGSYSFAGDVAAQQSPRGGTPFGNAVGLDTVEVEGPATRSFVAIGDSITEGYVSGTDDYRNGWSYVSQKALGLPVVNAAVSAQGVPDELAALDAEVLPLQGITDCIVLLGTNNLWDSTVNVDEGLAQLFARLKPFCRVWAATLLPKDRTSMGDYFTVMQRRLSTNAWIMQQTLTAGVVDLAPVLAASGDLSHYAPGLQEDGIHPSVLGQQRLGAAVASHFPAPAVDAMDVATGTASGGDTVTLHGSHFLTGASVLFDGTPSPRVVVQSDTVATAQTPAHASGTVGVELVNPTLQSGAAGSFTFSGGVPSVTVAAGSGGQPATTPSGTPSPGTLDSSARGVHATAAVPSAAEGCGAGATPALSSLFIVLVALMGLRRRRTAQRVRASGPSRTQRRHQG